MYLYHINIGFPVVDEGAELLVPTRSVTPRGDYSGRGLPHARCAGAGAISSGFSSTTSSPRRTARVPVGIVNRARGIGAYEVFNANQLPFHFVWRMLGEGTYVVGIEPCTNRTAGSARRPRARRADHAEPGESRVYDLELGALANESEIDAFTNRVSTLGGI